jgi:acetyl-CoA carboxylase carboxyl transferase subunit beta
MAMAEPQGPKKGDKTKAPAERRGGWLSRIAPGVRGAFAKRETPENLWVKCPDTGEMIYRSDLEAALWVTPAGRHMRIGPEARFKFTFDESAYEVLPTPPVVEDPLHFSDGKSYKDRLAAARKSTGEQDAMAIGFGKVGGADAVVLVQDFAFMGGSLGMAAGEGFIAAAEAAIKRQVPLIVFTAAGGARMQEGALSLMQMARTTLAINEMKDVGLPYVVVLTDPTTGGRHRLLRHAGRRPPGRAGRPDRLRRPPRDRTDHPRNPAAGLPALGIPSGKRHGRPRHPAQGAAGGAGLDPGHPHDGPRA